MTEQRRSRSLSSSPPGELASDREAVAEHRQLRYVPPSGAATLLLVRHGESAPFREDEPPPLLGGAGDPELDPVGVEQADRLAARLGSDDIAAIYVTPLRRTAQTAAPLAARLRLEPRVEPDLREVFLGEWEGGLYRKHMRERHPVALRLRETGRWDVIPGAESSEAFAARVGSGIGRIAAAHPDERVVVVVHGGVIGQTLALATGCRPLAFAWADNASISELVVGDDLWTVRSYNDTSHL